MEAKVKTISLIFITTIIILTFVFYWFEWRPKQIRQRCYDIAVSIGGVNFDKNYKSCLLDNGLKTLPSVGTTISADEFNKLYPADNNQSEILQEEFYFDLDLTSLSYVLPKYTKICIPTLRYDCASDGCRSNKPSVFILYDKDSSMVYRCDNNPCDGYKVFKDTSGLYTNLTPENPVGAIWKISADNKYSELISLGLDVIIYWGDCRDK